MARSSRRRFSDSTDDDDKDSDHSTTSLKSSKSSKDSDADTDTDKGSGDDSDRDAESQRSMRHRHRHNKRKRAAAPPPISRNNLIAAILIFLILAAAAVAAYFYTHSGSINSDKDATSVSGSEAGSGGTGTGTGSGSGSGSGTGGGGDGSGSGETTSKAASSAKPASSAAHSGASSGGGGGGGDSSKTSGGGGGGGGSASATGKSSKSGGGDGNSKTDAAAASPTASVKTGKKGVGYNDAKFTTNLDIDWAYNWASSGSGLNEGVMYVPMLWGRDKVADWEKDAKAGIAAGATHLLGFNEPDLPEQANMSPDEAAALWKANMEPHAGSAKLVSPGVTNGVKLDNGTSLGVPWLQDFIKACDGCTISAIALQSARLQDLFQGTGTPDEQATFMKFAVDYLEKQDWIEKYAAFGDFADNPVAEFVNDDGSLNDLGKAYSEAK
ncbi:hypothetical protein JCM11641_007330 [Rhodosporidiobolus odoratus]